MLNIGGASETFTLDAKGRAKSSQGTFALSLHSGRGSFPGGNVAFKAKLAHGDYAALWFDEGMDPATSVINASLNITFDLKLGRTLYGSQTAVLYSSKAGKGGKFRK